LSNRAEPASQRVQGLAGKTLSYIRSDVRRFSDVQIEHLGHFEAVVHFASSKAIEKSCEQPLNHFDNSVEGAIVLLQGVQSGEIRKSIFNSSATIHDKPDQLPSHFARNRTCSTDIPQQQTGAGAHRLVPQQHGVD
jgi:UDP-glucose 4-epimerase